MAIRTFSQSAQQRISDNVRWGEGVRAPGTRPGPEAVRRGASILVEITGQGTTGDAYYTATEKVWDRTNSQLKDGTRVFGGTENFAELIDVNGVRTLPVGSLGRARVLGGQWIVEPIAYGQVFPVDLTQTGGSAGNTTTQTTFTYTVNDLNANELATGVDPTSTPHRCERESLGPHVAATHGLASYLPSDTGPTLALVHTNEVLDTGACPT